MRRFGLVWFVVLSLLIASAAKYAFAVSESIVCELFFGRIVSWFALVEFEFESSAFLRRLSLSLSRSCLNYGTSERRELS